MKGRAFKYQAQIDMATAQGLAMPELFSPTQMEAFRFVFARIDKTNHLPALIKNPARKLPSSQTLSGYALSCYDSENNATRRYEALAASFPNISLAIGDALAHAKLSATDGMVTKVDDAGHFDFYEFDNCNPDELFTYLKQLI